MSDSTRRGAMVMSRKSFLRGIGALGATAVAAKMGLFTGAWAQEVGQPRKGGTLKFNLTGDPPNFDPLSGTSTVLMGIIAPCYNGLVRVDPSDPESIIPDLATSWEISEDGLTYTFPLTQGVKFHDGVPLTSADAKFTFETIRNPPEGVISARRRLLDNVVSIETPDENTIVFKLAQPAPSFLTNLSSCWMLVLPKHILEVKGNMREDIVGTGPFKLQRVTRGVSYELVRNPDYHVPDRPHLDAITAYVVPDAGTTWNYLQNGQLDLFYSIQGQDAGAYSSNDRVVIQASPSTSFIGINFNINAAPFDNILVRQALSIGVDRASALSVTHNNEGQLGGITVPGKWALSPERLAEVPGYGPDGEADIEEAKRLLAEAGFPNGFNVTVLVRKNPLFEPVGVFLKDQWEKIGVIATLDVQENATYADAIATGRFTVSASGGSYALEDPDSVFGDESVCGGGGGDACAPLIDDLFTRQSVEMDEDERRELVHQLELEVLKTYGIYVMYWRNRFMGMSTKLKNLKIHPNIDQNMRLEDVWLEA
jgi:peptide/nickel transport system substrate-binding protein